MRRRNLGGQLIGGTNHCAGATAAGATIRSLINRSESGSRCEFSVNSPRMAARARSVTYVLRNHILTPPRLPTVTTALCLDIDHLIEPIPGENPSGDARAYAHRLQEQLNELRREDDPADYDEATRPAEYKKADWDGVVELASAALQAESKDLRVACHLIEAMVHLEGFAGLHQGITLLKRLSENCWELLIPLEEEDDPEARSGPLANMLDDPVRGLCFPNQVRSLPILGQGETATSFFGWKKLQSEDSNARDRVLNATDVDKLQGLASECDECLEQLKAFCSLLSEKLGERAPSLLHLGEAINDCRKLAHSALQRLRPELGSPEETVESSAASEDATSATPTTTTNTDRLAVYQQIEDAANLLGRLEPHSPVPYLVKRAVELGRLPFPEMIKQFVREENTLCELYRELGINAPADEES